MSASESFVLSDVPRSENDDVDSIPSISTSILIDDYDEAQREWDASLEQLQLLLTVVLVPFVGKYLGRKFAYWSWARYMEWTHGVEIQWATKKTSKAGNLGAAAAL